MPTSRDLFVDTSGWACLISDRDPQHASVSRIILHAIRTRRLVTTNYIVAELVALLSTGRFSVDRQQLLVCVNAIKADPATEILHVDEVTDAEAWKLLEARADKEWSLVDASSFVVMRRFGMTEALTTDRHFEQAGFIRLPAP